METENRTLTPEQNQVRMDTDPARDAQMLESRQFKVVDICRLIHLKAMKKAETKVEQFCKFVNERFHLELDPEKFRRTYAGYWQKSAGAWSWFIHDGIRDYGSVHPITDLLKNKEGIELYNGDEFECEACYKSNHQNQER